MFLWCHGKNDKRRKKLNGSPSVPLLGLDNVGKTSVRSVLSKGSAPSDSAPSVDFGKSKAKFCRCPVSILIVGGGECIRNMWEHYFSGERIMICSLLYL